MPFRGKIGDKEYISIFLSEEEWSELQNRVKTENLDVEIVETGKLGYLKRSPKRLQYFAHKPGEAPKNWQPESEEHLQAKAAILLGCQDAGWKARAESFGNGWIADVLAETERVKIAFEVQWSAQTKEKTIERQRRYKGDNVLGCWFFRKIPEGFSDFDGNPIANKNIPLFKLEKTKDSQVIISFDNYKVPLRKFVRDLLSGKFRFCKFMSMPKGKEIEVYFNFYKWRCYKCGKWQYRYWIDPLKVVSGCVKNFEIGEYSWNDYLRVRFEPSIVNEARRICEEKGMILANVSKKYSTTTDELYWAFSCHFCDTLFVAEKLDREEEIARDVVEIETIKVTVKIDSRIFIMDNKHWCFSETKEFCSDKKGMKE